YLGMPVESLRDWETSGAVHPDDLPGVALAWRRALERGEPYEREQRLRCAEGSYRWAHVLAIPLRGAEGQLLHWFVMFTDVDDRKSSESILAGEKRLLEMVAAGSPLDLVLATMCTVVEEILPESTCSLLLVEPDGTFRYGAGPSLPPGYD